MTIKETKEYNTDDVLHYSTRERTKRDFSLIDSPPDFKMWALAPFWTLSQAVCLLCGMRTIDDVTVATIRAVVHNDSERKLLTVLHRRSEGWPIDICPTLRNYIVYGAPLSIEQCIKISRMYDFLTSKFLLEKLNPEEVIKTALEAGFKPHPDLNNGLSQRKSIDYWQLYNDPFSDEINVRGYFNKKRIEKNMAAPGHPSQVPKMLPMPSGDDKVEIPILQEIQSKEDLVIVQFPEAKSQPIEVQTHLSKAILSEVGSCLAEEAAIDSKPDCRDADIHSRCSKQTNEFWKEILGESSSALSLCIKNEGLQIPKKYIPGFASPKERKGKLRLTKALMARYRCVAIAKLLRHLDPSTGIFDIINHEVFKKYGLVGHTKPTDKTLRNWLNFDGIKDR